jgi:hypothetical protein
MPPLRIRLVAGLPELRLSQCFVGDVRSKRAIATIHLTLYAFHSLEFRRKLLSKKGDEDDIGIGHAIDDQLPSIPPIVEEA